MNRQRVERTPFTTYDIIGYLGPGIFALWLIVYCVRASGINTPDFADLFVFGTGGLGNAMLVVVGIVSAYGLGHILSYISSETIEKVALYFFNYPTVFLLRDSVVIRKPNERYENTTKGNRRYITNCLKERSRTQSSKRPKITFWVLLLFAWPITIGLLILWRLGTCRFILKKFSMSAEELLHKQFKEAVNKKIHAPKTGEEIDWYRYVTYYMAMRDNFAFARLYNYLTLYGFLRTMSLIFVFISYSSAYALWAAPSLTFRIHLDLPIHPNLWALFASISIAQVLFLAYLKFHRRYTEEGMWLFATGEFGKKD